MILQPLYPQNNYNKNLSFKSRFIKISHLSDTFDINEIRKGADYLFEEATDTFEKTAVIDSTLKQKFKTAEKAYQKMKEENQKIFLEAASPKKRGILKQFLNLETYDENLLPLLFDKKKKDLVNLYKIASQKDSLGNLRIHGYELPFFLDIPLERLKALNPILSSKNDFGMWNYPAKFISSLNNNYSDDEIAVMAKLAQYKVNGENLCDIVNIPTLNWQKTIEKAEGLNRLYGEDLREIAFFSNRFGDNFLSADIQLHDGKKPSGLNFKRVYTCLDDDVNAVQWKKSNTKIEKYIDNIYQKLEKQLHVTTPEELDNSILNILTAQPNATQQEVLSVMQRLTQFSSYASIKKLEDKFNKIGINKFSFDDPTNAIFNYYNKSKKIFNLTQNKTLKTAVIVTKDNLDNLERLSTKDSCNHFICLDGWDEGINLFTDNKLLEKRTLEVLNKTKKAQKENPDLTFSEVLDEVLNYDIKEKLKALGINGITISLDAPATKAIVLEQLKPIMPTKSLLKSTIESVAHHYTDKDKHFKKLSFEIAKYYDENLSAYSKQGLIENMKQIDKQINKFLEKNNLNRENLYLIRPDIPDEFANSFLLMNKMFSELFEIPPERNLIVNNVVDLNSLPENSTFVIIDDVVGTGSSMVAVGEYMFSSKRISKNQHILFCPLTASKSGLEYIQNNISFAERENIDQIIHISQHTKKYEKPDNFLGNSDNEKYNAIATNVFGYKGMGGEAMCTAFPYMTPDNNSTLACYLTKFFVPDEKCIKNKNNLLPEIEEKTYFYDVFGTDKENLTSENIKIYKPQKPLWLRILDLI